MTKAYIRRSLSENYQFCILFLLTLSQLVMSLGAYAWGPLAPFLREEFGISRTQIGLIVSSLFTVSSLVSLPSGFAVDKWGAKVMAIIALLIMGISFSALSMVDSFIVIVVIAGISGAGYGMTKQFSSKGLIQWFTKKNRATAVGICQTGVTLGGALGAAMLPAIALIENWKWATFVTGALIIATALLVFLFYKETPTDTGAKEVSAAPQPTGPTSAWSGNIIMLLKKPEFLVLSVVGMLLTGSQACITSFIVLYIKEELLYSAAMAGLCLSIFMIAGTVGRIAWGIISDRLFEGDRRHPMILLCLIAMAGASGMVLIGKGTLVWLPYILSAVMGFTFMGWHGLFITFVAETAGPALVGMVTGFALTVAWSGVIFAPPLFGFIADKAGYPWSWAMLAVIGILCSLFLYYTVRVSNRGQTDEKAA